MGKNTYRKSKDSDSSIVPKPVNSLSDSASALSEEHHFSQIENSLQALAGKGLSLDVVMQLLRERESVKKVISIPTYLLSNRKLGVLEVVVKYLKEEKGLSYHAIAKILARDDRTVWGTYHKASVKVKERFSAIKTSATRQVSISIPVEIFCDRMLGPLESVVAHLKGKQGLSFHQIAQMLNRDDRTIWTVYNQIQKKSKGGGRYA